MPKYRYPGFDIAKIIFACLIPFFHISFGTIVNKTILRGLTILTGFARLGVPFFMAVSGYFLTMSKENRGNAVALIRFEKRTGIMLLSWLIIYFPLIFSSFCENPIIMIQTVIFKTPAYLWYLTSVLFAAIPFCLIKNRKKLWMISIILYITGTLLGGAYSWITGGCPYYEKYFITTRNGLFFAMPMMCVGEFLWIKKSTVYYKFTKFSICVAFLSIEMLIAFKHRLPYADTSMYLGLPIVTFYLMALLREIKWNIDTRKIDKISAAIYLVQFGVISLANNIKMDFFMKEWCIYGAIILGGILLQYTVEKIPKLKFLI